MRKARLRAELARLEAELEEARPFLGLAREIHGHVKALSDADVDALAEALEAVPRRERVAAARVAFAQLPAETRWVIVERVLDDDELRELLEAERAVQAKRAALANEVIASRRLDLSRVTDGEVLTLGLFRAADVTFALERGPKSTACARRLVVRAENAEDGRSVFRVLEDVYNPSGGYFVTHEYDETVWRQCDRLPAHALVRLGSITKTGDETSFTPTLFLGGRVDVEADGRWTEGRLHLGFALLG